MGIGLKKIQSISEMQQEALRVKIMVRSYPNEILPKTCKYTGMSMDLCISYEIISEIIKEELIQEQRTLLKIAHTELF